MTSAHNPISRAADAERLLGSLAGVVSAHVVADAAGNIVEIHILSSPDLHPKQMVRNVESALSAGLGLTIDRRIVSVAQLRTDVDSNGHRRAQAAPDLAGSGVGAGWRPGPGEETTPDDPPYAEDGEEPRLEFIRYQSRRDAEHCTCEVVFRSGREEVTGAGSGPDTAAGRTEAAARAVFDGLGKARPDLVVELEAAVISQNRGRSYVIVAAHAVLQRDSVRLAGAAALSRSPEEAAILAALQATNRWSA
jgi:hypothetical protein